MSGDSEPYNLPVPYREPWRHDGGKGFPRRTVYTQSIDDEVCERLANGELLMHICKDAHLPPEATVRQWAWQDFYRHDPTKLHAGFGERFYAAVAVGLEREMEEVRAISDEMQVLEDLEYSEVIKDDPENGITTTRTVKRVRKDATYHRRLRIEARLQRNKFYAERQARAAEARARLPGSMGADATPTQIVLSGGLPAEED